MPVMPPPAEWSYVTPGTASATDVDIVRFWLQDTDPSVRLMSDLELQWLVDQWMPKHDSLVYVAAVAADVVATKFAGIVTVSADGVSVDVSDISARYAVRAAALRETNKAFQVGGEVDITNLLWDQNEDSSIDPLNFGVGMHDNPQAGRQAYGSNRQGAVWSDLIAGGYG